MGKVSRPETVSMVVKQTQRKRENTSDLQMGREEDERMPAQVISHDEICKLSISMYRSIYSTSMLSLNQS